MKTNYINDLNDFQSLILISMVYNKNKIDNFDDETQTYFINYLTGYLNCLNENVDFVSMGYDINKNMFIVEIKNEKINIMFEHILNNFKIMGWV